MKLKYNNVKTEIKTVIHKIVSPIITVPGIGYINVASIFGEFGDISRFSNAFKFAVYAGIDASVCQSGVFQSSNNKMRKRGSPYLRKTLFQAAFVAAFHELVFSAFYLKKRIEGKRHYIPQIKWTFLHKFFVDLGSCSSFFVLHIFAPFIYFFFPIVFL